MSGGDDSDSDAWFSDWVEMSAGHRHHSTTAVYNTHTVTYRQHTAPPLYTSVAYRLNQV